MSKLKQLSYVLLAALVSLVETFSFGVSSAQEPSPLQFLCSYDAGLTGPIGGGLGTTNRGDEIIVTPGIATAILDLRLSEPNKNLERRYALQNVWAAKQHPVLGAVITDIPIAPAASFVLSPDDRHFYTNGFGEVAFPYHYRRETTTGILTPVPIEQDQIDSGSGFPPASCLAMPPDGLALYATSWHSLYAFERNLKSGKLKLCQVIEDDSKGTSVPGERVVKFHKIPGATTAKKLRGVKDLVVSGDGKFLYAISYQEMAVTTFSRNMETGRLTELESLCDEQEKFGEDRFGKWIAPHKGLLFATRGNLSPDSANLYVATISDAVVVFARDKESGKLAYVETIRNKDVAPERDPNWIPALDYCVDVCVSPDGKQVYVACQEKGAIVVFQRDAAGQGKLKYLATLDAKTTPGCRLRGVSRLCTTRDGKFLLALSSEALVNVFRRTDVK